MILTQSAEALKQALKDGKGDHSLAEATRSEYRGKGKKQQQQPWFQKNRFLGQRQGGQNGPGNSKNFQNGRNKKFGSRKNSNFRRNFPKQQ
nr:hypothetical protein BaRGS_009435 [Batillaria attramentaria]